MTIKAVFFDIGGVLENNPRLHYDAKWAPQFGLTLEEMRTRLDTLWRDGSLGLISLDDVHLGISTALNITAEQVTAYMEDAWVEYVGTLNVELTEYFRSLRGRTKTGIISNSFVGAREREMPLYHFDEMTDVIIYSHEVQLGKPDPRIFTLACEQLGVLPQEAIFLDDVEGHIAAARAVGMHGIVFTETQKAIAEIEACLREC
jgi:epoxide hydrolase-like predicted phosphatase